MKRTIMIFPNISNVDRIEEIRREFDPLFGKIRPHISLVFTFEDDISNDNLLNMVSEKLQTIESFIVLFDKFQVLGNYLVLTSKKANQKLIKLHNLLTEDYFKAYFYPDFIPHITLGSFCDEKEAILAYNRISNQGTFFEFVVNSVTIEEVQADDSSKVIGAINLLTGKNPHSYISSADKAMILNDRFEENLTK